MSETTEHLSKYTQNFVKAIFEGVGKGLVKGIKNFVVLFVVRIAHLLDNVIYRITELVYDATDLMVGNLNTGSITHYSSRNVSISGIFTSQRSNYLTSGAKVNPGVLDICQQIQQQ